MQHNHVRITNECSFPETKYKLYNNHNPNKHGHIKTHISESEIIESKKKHLRHAQDARIEVKAHFGILNSKHLQSKYNKTTIHSTHKQT